MTDYTFDKITCTKFNFPIDKFSKDQLSKDHLSTDQIYRRSVVIGSNVQKISCHRFKCPKDQLSRRSNVKRSVVYSSNVQKISYLEDQMSKDQLSTVQMSNSSNVQKISCQKITYLKDQFSKDQKSTVQLSKRSVVNRSAIQLSQKHVVFVNCFLKTEFCLNSAKISRFQELFDFPFSDFESGFRNVWANAGTNPGTTLELTNPKPNLK